MRASPYLIAAGIIAAVVLSSRGALANDQPGPHFPRYTTAPAQVNVIPATDPGWSLDPAMYPWLKLAVDNWNFAANVHLNLLPPQPCAWLSTAGMICAMEEHDGPGTGGHFGVVPYPTNTSLALYAQAIVNADGIPIGDPFWSTMIECHELGEALGLPDPSDDPVTPTVAPTCLTRDYAYLTSIPSDANFAQLDRLYSGVDSPPVVCAKRNGKCKP